MITIQLTQDDVKNICGLVKQELHDASAWPRGEVERFAARVRQLEDEAKQLRDGGKVMYEVVNSAERAMRLSHRDTYGGPTMVNAEAADDLRAAIDKAIQIAASYRALLYKDKDTQP